MSQLHRENFDEDPELAAQRQRARERQWEDKYRQLEADARKLAYQNDSLLQVLATCETVAELQEAKERRMAALATEERLAYSELTASLEKSSREATATANAPRAVTVKSDDDVAREVSDGYRQDLAKLESRAWMRAVKFQKGEEAVRNYLLAQVERRGIEAAAKSLKHEFHTHLLDSAGFASWATDVDAAKAQPLAESVVEQRRTVEDLEERLAEERTLVEGLRRRAGTALRATNPVVEVAEFKEDICYLAEECAQVRAELPEYEDHARRAEARERDLVAVVTSLREKVDENAEVGKLEEESRLLESRLYRAHGRYAEEMMRERAYRNIEPERQALTQKAKGALGQFERSAKAAAKQPSKSPSRRRLF
eukprot:TRINITY_DN40470_c0_g1_i1.p1 TRINITY_DN40470_c0_g1~~TRINITY_DN40470_c0_g1_i1.p1  ORF type:complete len:368 (+),score=106.13 TRINITY_DN40470_c0_g1_i1:272-1375(+)